MEAYSERAVREEEQDIKEREAAAEEGGGGLLKLTAIFITVLVNHSASLPNQPACFLYSS